MRTMAALDCGRGIERKGCGQLEAAAVSFKAVNGSGEIPRKGKERT